MAKLIGAVDGLHENVRLWLESQGPCAQCGEDVIAIYGTPTGLYAECAGAGNMCAQRVLEPVLAFVLMSGVRVGLIEGRHPLPVEQYLLSPDPTAQQGYHGGVYWAAYQAGRELAKTVETIHLYLTGLTTAAIGAVVGMKADGVANVVLFSYDSASGKYIPIPI